MKLYYLDPETKTPKLVEDPLSFDFGDVDNRIKRDVLPNGKVVSTVFLSIDHSFCYGAGPLHFECCVFPSEGDFLEIDGERASTYEEILKIHDKMVEKHS